MRYKWLANEGINTFAIELKVPSNISEWPTGKEAFGRSSRKYTIEGIPANLAAYRLVNGEPALNLLERKGNLLASEEFSWDAYNGILSHSPFVLPGRMRDYVLKAIEEDKSSEFTYSGMRIDKKGNITAEGNPTSLEKRLFLSVMGTENPAVGSCIKVVPREVIEKALCADPCGIIVSGCWVNTHEKTFLADINYKFTQGVPA